MKIGKSIGKSIVFELENQKMKVKTLKNLNFVSSNVGHIRVKKQKVLKLVRGCQVITENVQMQL